MLVRYKEVHYSNKAIKKYMDKKGCGLYTAKNDLQPRQVLEYYDESDSTWKEVPVVRIMSDDIDSLE